jgi:ElaB/YqjD/DUF883 family membrane-anchored ribosome-binding protein
MIYESGRPFDSTPSPPVVYDTPITPEDRFNQLLLVLEDLLKRIADTEDPKIRRMRAQVHSELVSIRNDTSRLNSLTILRTAETILQTADEDGWEVSIWGHQALAALAGAAVALSVFRQD